MTKAQWVLKTIVPLSSKAPLLSTLKLLNTLFHLQLVMWKMLLPKVTLSQIQKMLFSRSWICLRFLTTRIALMENIFTYNDRWVRKNQKLGDSIYNISDPKSDALSMRP